MRKLTLIGVLLAVLTMALAGWPSGPLTADESPIPTPLPWPTLPPCRIPDIDCGIPTGLEPGDEPVARIVLLPIVLGP